MSSSQLREALIKQIEIADERFLKVLYAMMEAYVEQYDVVGYRPNGEPISTKELKHIVEEGREAIARGEYKTLDDLEKEAEEW